MPLAFSVCLLILKSLTSTINVGSTGGLAAQSHRTSTITVDFCHAGFKFLCGSNIFIEVFYLLNITNKNLWYQYLPLKCVSELAVGVKYLYHCQ